MFALCKILINIWEKIAVLKTRFPLDFIFTELTFNTGHFMRSFQTGIC